MSIGEICNREVVFATRETTVREAAQLMREYHVGDLLVVDPLDEGRVPVGIVTDRDIVIGILAEGLDPDALTMGDIIGPQLVTASHTDGVFETIQQMRIKGVRRMPIVDEEGGLVGIVSVDDLLALVSEEMSELARLIAREQAREIATRR